MFNNYLKFAFRRIIYHNSYSLINIVGLAVGFSACVLIFLWVQDEMSYDKFHEKSDRIFRTIWEARSGDNEWSLPVGPVPIGDLLMEFPDVENVTQLRLESQKVIHNGQYLTENDFLFTDKDFFNVFTVEFITGTPATAFSNPQALVITEQVADRYFPDEEPVGQILKLDNGTSLQVTAVVKGFPRQSHIRFDFLLPLSLHPNFEQRRDQWSSASVFTYFTLSDKDNRTNFETNLNHFLNKTIFKHRQSENYSRFSLQSLTDIYLGPDKEYDLISGGNKANVYQFSITGLLILLLVCINYINLATAISVKRAREVGILKVSGAQKNQLTIQFLLESFLYVLLAMIVMTGLVELSLPYFNNLTEKTLSQFGDSTFSYIISIFLAGAIVAIAAGSFPAFLLSSFQPVAVLKGSFEMIDGRKDLRNTLVILQLCITIVFIVGALVIHSQWHFIQNKRLGFNQEHILVIEGSNSLRNQKDVFIRQIEALPMVVKATSTMFLPGYEFDSIVFEFEQPANFRKSSMTYNMIDSDFIDVLELELLKGRNFSRALTTDSSAFLINETAALTLGWQDPIGKEISMMGGQVKGPVIGVLKDFHLQSLHHEVRPVIFPYSRWDEQYIAVRLHPVNLAEVVQKISEAWHLSTHNQPMQYRFLNEQINQLYQNEIKVAQISKLATGLAILIACLGLFGLTSFTVEKKTREIGIRKVLGASVISIISMLTYELCKLFFIAMMISIPMAWYIMNRWLENFAYRIEMGPGVFFISGFLTVLIVLITVSWQSVKAALMNPVDSLKNE